MAAFNNGNFATRKEPVDHGFVDESLLQLVDGEATRAAPGGPLIAPRGGPAHCAYT